MKQETFDSIFEPWWHFRVINFPLLQLALEEEDVWRGVLNWAKYGAGVAQPTAHWTEEERLRVCQQLQGVINHVRLLLIGECRSVTGTASLSPHFISMVLLYMNIFSYSLLVF